MSTKTRGRGIIEHEKLGRDRTAIAQALANRLVYTVGKDAITATERDWFYTTAYATRDLLIDRWMDTMRSYYHGGAKRVYYLSLEFLMGRALMNSLLNLGSDEACREALGEIGVDLRRVREMEHDAGLGNGGLGRLAACFLDSMATLDLPGYGYGIRYEYGMFWQCLAEGRQVEHPDNWLRYGNPWEFARPEVLFPVKFHGRVVQRADERGGLRHDWVDTDDVMAMAYDTPIPGYGTDTVNNMRLWSAKATRDFDLQFFNEGDYIKAVQDKNGSETLSKVLYPDDSTEAGRELRLKQQYFFVCASLQDILLRYGKSHDSFDELPDKVAIQLNDTHPAIAIVELMRILVDLHGIDWDKAWDITVRTFAYTNHTLMPEALETWPVGLFEHTLPRHLQLIYEINHRFLEEVVRRHPDDAEMPRRVSLIDETDGKRVRMAHLAVLGSHKVNGVAEMHTELMKRTIFVDFHRIYPDKIVNMTNGITPRRWLNQANPRLSALITSRIGADWVKDLTRLRQLVPLAEEEEFRSDFAEVKRSNKEHLAAIIRQRLDLVVDVDSLFDVQIKRVHEYKRQLLNLLHVVTRYNRLVCGVDDVSVPRTVIFSGKAAPGYVMAKSIIHLINDVAEVVNNDPRIGHRLKVVFIPNYDVSTAEEIIPAADLSEQISTAGTEASGTGNMKLALNGALTIGTLDGANVEIAREVGRENIFVFGLTVEDVARVRSEGYRPTEHYDAEPELRQALDMIGSGYFSPTEPDRYRPVVDALLRHGDRYLVLADYASYVLCQEKVDRVYRDRAEWLRKAVLNVANMGKFSSDRTIQRYAEEIWNTAPVVRGSR